MNVWALAVCEENPYCAAVTIELPDAEIESLHLTPARALLELAVGLYAGGQITMGKAARIAGIPYQAFMQEIGTRGICINYTVEDALHDVEAVNDLCHKLPGA